jgi:hypothetical protein
MRKNRVSVDLEMGNDEYLEFTKVRIIVQVADDEGEEHEGHSPTRILTKTDLKIHTKCVVMA